MKRQMKWLFFFFFISLIMLMSEDIRGKGVGLPFLKIDTGARQAGMGGVFTGVGDDVYTLYWNPGGLGHIRRWQWSVGYNRWFADIYQANLSIVRQFRGLGSRKTSFGLSCNYLGMPSWDATGGVEEKVSASHFVGGLSIGQRMDWIHQSVALGLTVKTIQSQMADYSATGFAGDIGVLIRPNRFRLGKWGIGIFDYGFISLGISLSHFGPDIKFDQEVTSLPETYRTGLSFQAGTYRSWSFLLASDWMQVKNSDAVIGVGSEIWWKEILGIRFGYRFNNEDLGDFSFGLSFRWDDVMNSLLNLPQKYGDAMEVSIADVSYGEVLHQTYRGTFTHYPVVPEPFILNEPENIKSEYSEKSTVHLQWEKSLDPDAYDDLGYLLVVDKDKRRVQRAVRALEQDMRSFLNSYLKDSLLVCVFVPTTSFDFLPDKGGLYYWAVSAYDRSYHTRLARKGREKVHRFIVDVPDLFVKEIVFFPYKWITTTPEQGFLKLQVINQGSALSDSVHLMVTDRLLDAMIQYKIDLCQCLIHPLEPGADTTFEISWQTEIPGKHLITTLIDPESKVLEMNEDNNRTDLEVFTIPKGILSVPDSVEVMVTGFEYAEVPIVPEVYFEAFSDRIDGMYIDGGNGLPGLLTTFAQRLLEYPEVTLEIMGSIDWRSDEHDLSVAEKRAKNVKETLIQLGIPESQLKIVNNHSNKILGKRRRPRTPQDNAWVQEQNRVVAIQIPQEYEEKIFRPHSLAVDTTSRDSVRFLSQIVSGSGIADWTMEDHIISNEVRKSRIMRSDSLWGNFAWDGTDREKVLVPRNRWYRYTLILTDTLGRQFSTHRDSVYLQEKRTIRRQEIFGAAKFAQVEPVYQFYWYRLMDVAREMIENPNLLLRFEGHACAIGPDQVNQRLSLRRAKRFTQAFMKRVKNTYPEYYQNIQGRVADPIGFGEKEPFRLKLKGHRDMLLGDNDSPVGRYLNRRIAVLLYREN